MGKRDIDFRAVKAELEQQGYDGWIVLEQDVIPGMGRPKESARRNREVLANISL